jgi:hypothetical protein
MRAPSAPTSPKAEKKNELLNPPFEKLTPLQQCVADEFTRALFLTNIKLAETLENDHVPLRTKILADKGIDWVIDQVTAPNTPYSSIREECVIKIPPGR